MADADQDAQPLPRCPGVDGHRDRLSGVPVSPERDIDLADLDPQLRADFEAVFGCLPRPFPPRQPDSPSAPAHALIPPRANTGD